MEITVKEAADALSVSSRFVSRTYTGERGFSEYPYAGIDSEVLCGILNVDHRFLMAFLTGYDISLSYSHLRYLFDKSQWWITQYIRTVPVLVVPSEVRFGKVALVRYSYRRVAPLLQAQLEKKNGNHRASKYGGGTILPAPDTLPFDTWTFRSALTTEGTRLPRSRSTRLEHGADSALPIPDRGAEWKRRGADS